MKSKLILIALITIAAILLYFTLFEEKQVEKSDPYGHLKILPVKVRDGFVFIKYAYGGITDDKEIIVISRDSSQVVDEDKDIVLDGLRNSYLYFIKRDTLNILLLGMKQRKENHNLNNIIKIDTSESSRMYYNLYNKGLMVDDSIRLMKF